MIMYICNVPFYLLRDDTANFVTIKIWLDIICLSILIAIHTAAIEMIMGEAGVKGSRIPEIMSDAAYAILTKPSREMTGQFVIDDDILRKEGITDFEPYSNVLGKYSTLV